MSFRSREAPGSSLSEPPAGTASAREQRASGTALEATVAERISLLRLVLICAIVFIHVPVPDAYLSPSAGGFAMLRAILCDGLFRVTVPMLTAISGFLLFRASLDRRWGELLRRKSRTILLPLVVWNLPLLVALYVVERDGLGGHEFAVRAYPFDLWTWVDSTLGLTYQPANYPLYFLRDLFVTSLMAPIMGLLLRRAPWLGLALVVGLFYPDLDGSLILRDTMPINFYLGGLVAVRRWNVRRLDRVWPLCVAALAVSAAAIGAFAITDIRWFAVAAPFLVWPASSALAGTRASRWMAHHSSKSFAIFVSHAPILVALWVVFEHVGSDRIYPAFWLSAPFVAMAVAVAIRLVAYRVVPHLAALAYGAR